MRKKEVQGPTSETTLAGGKSAGKTETGQPTGLTPVPFSVPCRPVSRVGDSSDKARKPKRRTCPSQDSPWSTQDGVGIEVREGVHWPLRPTLFCTTTTTASRDRETGSKGGPPSVRGSRLPNGDLWGRGLPKHLLSGTGVLAAWTATRTVLLRCPRLVHNDTVTKSTNRSPPTRDPTRTVTRFGPRLGTGQSTPDHPLWVLIFLLVFHTFPGCRRGRILVAPSYVLPTNLDPPRLSRRSSK